MTLILNGTDNSASVPAVTGTDTDTGIYYPAANQVAIATNGTQAMLANSVQGVQFANAIGVGATTPTTSGAGITFPASQSASTDANTLDDYEEGTWTPTLSAGSGTAGTYTTRIARYIKIGKMVWLWFYIGVDKGTLANQLYVTGFPFTVEVLSGQYQGSALSYWSGLATAQVNMTAYVNEGQTRCEIHAAAAAVTTILPAQATILGATNNEFIAQMCYQAA